MPERTALMEWMVTLGGAAVAGLVWLLRLEGKVKVLEAQFSIVKDDLRYIRDRIDKAIDA